MKNENVKYKPSMIGIFFLLAITGGIWYLAHNYGLKEIIEMLSSFVEKHKNMTYLIAFLLAVAEGTVILAMIPGSWAILAIGAVSVTAGLNIFVLYALVVLGAVIGDNIGYFLGGIYGRRIINSGFIDPLQYRMAEDFVSKHGGKSIATSRLINIIKELAPFIAGSVKMDKKTFMIFNFLGALMWGLLWLGLGYIFSSNLDLVEKNLTKILQAVAIVFALAVGWYIYKNQHLIEEFKKDLE